MTILACSGFDEGPGANFTPPTLGEFMKKRESEVRLLREARAGAIVTREARLFHERQAKKHGINTSRGLAHFRASKMFTREASKLQEMFENGGQLGELPPKAVIKANKAAMMFHKKQAEKNGLDSDVGHAHVAAMEHHADIIKKAKAQGQQPQQEANEGGPGSGRHKGIGAIQKLQKQQDRAKSWKQYANLGAKIEDIRHKPSSKEALPGYGGKQSPVPVPRKADMPSQDEKDPNKPPVNLNPADANKQPRKLQQTAGAHAGMIRAGGPGSGPHGSSGLGKPFDRQMSRHRSLVRAHSKAIDKLNSLENKYPRAHPAVQRAEKAIKKIHSAISENLRSHQKESRRSAIERFGREADEGGPGSGRKPGPDTGSKRRIDPKKLTRSALQKRIKQGDKANEEKLAKFGKLTPFGETERLDMGTGCDYPKGVGRQVEPYLVTRQPRTKESIRRRFL